MNTNNSTLLEQVQQPTDNYLQNINNNNPNIAEMHQVCQNTNVQHQVQPRNNISNQHSHHSQSCDPNESENMDTSDNNCNPKLVSQIPSTIPTQTHSFDQISFLTSYI
mmetsp:Transcript_1100/g.1591  ORF Transcript_1100/g.1591 Transcript_1100/m.1591 type:complete len:108 (+) Transcript_1100:144-467(+)